ncbi:hypothetical protein TNCV_4775371 [Trichonephila clavipes]|nr:hypothetical protein TNCV_4775371 [Trichonephila clavipes]
MENDLFQNDVANEANHLFSTVTFSDAQDFTYSLSLILLIKNQRRSKLRLLVLSYTYSPVMSRKHPVLLWVEGYFYKILDHNCRMLWLKYVQWAKFTPPSGNMLERSEEETHVHCVSTYKPFITLLTS